QNSGDASESMTDTTTAFSVRQAGVSDARTLAELGARLFEQTFAAANTAEDMRVYLSTAFKLDELTAELADDASAIWIAEDSTGTGIGYAVLRRGTSADGVVADQSAEIHRI